ncbi:MAG TPA: hypothetical protein VFV32_00055 [Acidimicrobiales bacterium]|nr:hypothetical protein [Acidimicrobiales bacterium]
MTKSMMPSSTAESSGISPSSTSALSKRRAAAPSMVDAKKREGSSSLPCTSAAVSPIAWLRWLSTTEGSASISSKSPAGGTSPAAPPVIASAASAHTTKRSNAVAVRRAAVAENSAKPSEVARTKTRSAVRATDVRRTRRASMMTALMVPNVYVFARRRQGATLTSRAS